MVNNKVLGAVLGLTSLGAGAYWYQTTPQPFQVPTQQSVKETLANLKNTVLPSTDSSEPPAKKSPPTSV